MISKKLPVDWSLYNPRLINWARWYFAARLAALARYAPPEVVETLPEDAMIETCQRWKPGGLAFSGYYVRIVRYQMHRHANDPRYVSINPSMRLATRDDSKRERVWSAEPKGVSSPTAPQAADPNPDPYQAAASRDAVEFLGRAVAADKLLARRLVATGKRRKVRVYERAAFYEKRDRLREACL